MSDFLMLGFTGFWVSVVVIFFMVLFIRYNERSK